MKVQKSIVITVSSEKVWPFLTEPAKIVKWYDTMKNFKYKGEMRSGVGMPFYFEEPSPMGTMKINFIVTEWIENSKIAFKMTSGKLLKGYEQVWSITAVPSGSRFTFSEDVKLPYGVLGKIIGFFGRFSSMSTAKKILTTLKTEVEAKGL